MIIYVEFRVYNKHIFEITMYLLHRLSQERLFNFVAFLIFDMSTFSLQNPLLNFIHLTTCSTFLLHRYFLSYLSQRR